MRFLQGATVVASLLMQSGGQALWASIRSLQMAIYPGLANINYPAKNLLLLTLLISFANMDPGVSLSENYIIPLIPLHETDPSNDQFDQFDIGSLNYIQNSGAFILMILCFWIWLLVKKMVHQVCILFKRFQWACEIGRRVYDEQYFHKGVKNQ